MILMIDNYDSFTYNLVDYLGQLTDISVAVYRNDALDVAAAQRLNPTCVVISPGPKTPAEAGVSKALIQAMHPTTPILGVCLGHQAIGEVFGATVVRAPRLMHGKTSWIKTQPSPLFDGLENPFEATRYHSLVLDPPTIQDCLTVIATATDDATIMAVAHAAYPVYGVQFHPESILTVWGKQLLRNFLSLAGVSCH